MQSKDIKAGTRVIIRIPGEEPVDGTIVRALSTQGVRQYIVEAEGLGAHRGPSGKLCVNHSEVSVVTDEQVTALAEIAHRVLGIETDTPCTSPTTVSAGRTSTRSATATGSRKHAGWRP